KGVINLKKVMVNFEKCLGCHTCELACATSHSKAKSFLGAVLGGETPPISVKVLADKTMCFPLQCRHCTDAHCIKACITHALHRDEVSGAVICDSQKCVGCWMCVMTCPLGAISEGLNHKAVKCDLCKETGVPACAASCPTGALTYEEIEEYDQGKKTDYIVNYLKGAM
ncbi:MAG: 4Fe-4S dicluster domain-containing protein, partial [Clostridiales bacterium]